MSLSPNTLSNRAPYPGLRPFRRDEADLFFGREEQVDQLLEKLENCRFLAVVGLSGCGKSSLVKAGMFSAIESGFMASAGARWRIAEMRPGNRPLTNLTQALLESSALGERWSGQPESAPFLAASLRRGPLGLVEVLREAPLPERTNLLLLVDQFEEIFRFREHGDRNEAAAFVDLLLTTARQTEAPVYVVITMRSDYLGDCALFAGLPEALNVGQFLTPRLTREQCRAAILGPAAIFSVEIEPILVNRLLNDVGTNPDQLPLLQHVLMRLWTRATQTDLTAGDSGQTSRPGNGRIVLSGEDYDQVGGLGKALSNHADEAYGDLGPDDQRVAETLFRCLSEKPDKRRLASVDEIRKVALVTADKVIAIAEVFRRPDRSFLTPPASAPLEPETYLDISHESFIRQWDKMKKWVNAEGNSASFYRHLLETARRWEAGEAGLWDTPDLENALAWRTRESPNADWAERYGGGFAVSKRFLDRSEETQKQKRLQEEQRVKRELELRDQLAKAARQRAEIAEQREKEQVEVAARLRRRAILATVVSVVAFALAVASSVLLKQSLADKKKAEEAQREADHQTHVAVAQRLAAESTKLTSQSPQVGVLLAVEAVKATLKDGVVVQAAEQALRDVLTNCSGRGFSGPTNQITAIAVSPDGRWAAAASKDGNAWLWDLIERNTLPTRLPMTNQMARLGVAAISLNNRWLAMGAYDGTVVLWALQDANPARSPIVLAGHTNAVSALVFSHDSRWLITGDDGGCVRRCDLSVANSSGSSVELAKYGQAIKAIGILQDDQIVIVCEGGKIIRADLAALGRPHSTESLPDQLGQIDNFGISSGARWLVTATVDGRILRWELSTLAGSHVSSELTNQIVSLTSLAVSSDGHWVAAGGNDSTARLWKIGTSNDVMSFVLSGHSEPITAIAISADNHWLVTGSEDQTIRAWDLTLEDPGNESMLMRKLGMTIDFVAVSPNKRWVVAASENGDVMFSELSANGLSRRQSRPPPLNKSGGRGALSRDQRWAAGGWNDGSIVLWDLGGQDPTRPAKSFQDLTGPVAGIALSADGRWLAAFAANGNGVLRDLRGDNETGTPITLLGPDKPTEAVAFSDDNQWLLAGDEGGMMRKWSLNSNGLSLKPITFKAHDDRISAIAMDASNRFLVTASWDKNANAKIWDFKALQPSAPIAVLSRHEGQVSSVAISPTGRWVVTRSYEKSARLWNLPPTSLYPEPIRLDGHQSELSAVHISPDEHWLVTAASRDSEVRLWDLRAPNPSKTSIVLRGHEGSVRALAISGDSQWLITGGYDGTVRRWNLSVNGLLEQARLAAGRNLTREEWRETFGDEPFRKTFNELP